jgi:hypothetical protein
MTDELSNKAIAAVDLMTYQVSLRLAYSAP